MPRRRCTAAVHRHRLLKELFFFDMLAHGIWLARRGMFALSLPIGDAECDKLEAVVEEFLASRRSVLAG